MTVDLREYFSEEVVEYVEHVVRRWRGKDAWEMWIDDIIVAHGSRGFDYEMNGDLRP